LISSPFEGALGALNGDDLEIGHVAGCFVPLRPISRVILTQVSFGGPCKGTSVKITEKLGVPAPLASTRDERAATPFTCKSVHPLANTLAGEMIT
jgi:hypothetical protein